MTPKRGDSERNFNFRAECRSIQPRMELLKIHAFSRYIDPRIRKLPRG